MTQFTVATIVEGHGEVKAVPLLIRALKPEWAAPMPCRGKRQRLVKENYNKNLEHYLPIARANITGTNGALLVIIDSDDDCPAQLGPALLQRCKAVIQDVPVAVVIAKTEFEAWFIAGNALPNIKNPDPESLASPKSVVKNALNGIYSETVDMPSLVSKMDYAEAANNSPSFSKLVRDIEQFIV